jgi:hypothetical protein
MILLFNGCSHTEGAQITSTRTWANIVCKSIVRNSQFIHIKKSNKLQGQTVYGYLNNINEILKLNDNLGISIARSGKGNDAICFETIEAIEKLKSVNKKPDYVFIQWSGVNRRVIQLPDKDIIEYVNVHDGVDYYPPLDPFASNLSITYIKILETYMKHNNISYVFLPYMEFTDTEEYSNTSTYKSLDFNNIVLHENGLGKFITHFRKNHLTVDEAGHPTTLGNWFIDNYFIDKMDFDLDVIGYFYFNKLTCRDSSFINFDDGITIELDSFDSTCSEWETNEINQGYKSRHLFQSYIEREKDHKNILSKKINKIFG